MTVACRRTFHTLVEGVASPIEVEWDVPVRDQNDWRCDFRIIWRDGSTRQRYAMGVDSTQALILALSLVGVELSVREPGAFWFNAGETLGLPALGQPDDPQAPQSGTQP